MPPGNLTCHMQWSWFESNPKLKLVSSFAKLFFYGIQDAPGEESMTSHLTFFGGGGG